MANSVVKVTDVTHDTITDSLLLLVGEDGTVTPDRSTVENYLNFKSGPTNLQIMHIDKHDPKGIDVIVDNVTYMPDNMEIVNEEDVMFKETPENLEAVALNLYNIKLDHDYTPLTSPKRVSLLQEEDDELAKTLSILHGNEEPENPLEPAFPRVTAPSHIATTRTNKSINIISSITIPAPGSSTAISASSPALLEKEKETPHAEIAHPAKPKGKAKILHTQPKVTAKKAAVKGRKPVRKVEKKEEPSEEESEEESDELEEEEDDEEFEDYNLEMADDDNDSDFDIQEELSGKKTKRVVKVTKIETRRATRLSESAKDTPKTLKTPKLKNAGKEKASKEEDSEGIKSKTEKVEKKSAEKDKRTDTEKPTDKEPEKSSENKTEESPTEAKQAEVKPEEPKSPDKKLPKKKKEPPKPIPGDFLLFSTPDIIRKVGGKEPTTPSTFEATPTTPKLVKGTGEQNKTTPTKPKVETPTSSKPGKITHESRSKSSTESSQTPNKSSRHSLDEKERNDKEKHHVRTSSTDTKTGERRDSIDKMKHSKSVDEKSSKDHVHGASHGQERRSSDANLDRKSSESSSVRRASDVSERRSSDSSKSSSKHEHSHSKHDHGSSRYSRDSSESQEQIPSAEDIRAIIMNEDTKTYTTNTINIPETPVLITNNVVPSGINLDASGLDLDQSILDNINNDMISEDILYQVAQQLVSNTELQNAIDKGINEGVLDASSLQEAMDISQMSQSSNSSFSESQQSGILREATQIVRPDGRVVVLPPVERPTTRSRNKRRDNAKPSFKTVHKPLDDEHVSGNELDSSDDGEEESEDDPNKLWCICNQPHNNRFMICCDTCEEWYHGKCVNITKAMGQQMEAEGKEWICLFCKDSSLKRPLAAARRIRKASRNSRQSTDSNSSAKQKEKEKSVNSIPCVVCQKAARKNSIYCSESCILAHAHGIERVVVFERSSGNMLTGNKAPSAVNLDQWLKEHPGYEVLRSAGKVVTTKVKPGGPLTQSKLKIVKNKHNEGVSLAIQQKGLNIGILKHAPKHSAQPDQQQSPQTNKAVKVIKIFQKDSTSKETKIKLIQPQPMPAAQLRPIQQSTPIKAKVTVQTLLAPKLPVTPTSKTPKKETPKKETPKKETPKKETPKEIKQKTPKPKPKEEVQTPQPKQEDIRDNVQKTIFEQLNVRMKGGDINLTNEEVKDVSVEIEAELYKCFGDTGQKYKNKYRSLIFNIKDPKNQTLWRRICEKSISSYELVRLSPDDMASQELAKWREQEAKHQLDMIKKSEIELLNCNRQYVLKTHKGEEVLEDNRPGNKADNTEIIKSLTEGSTLDPGVEEKLHSSKERDRERDKRSTSKHSHKEKNRDKDRHSNNPKRDKDKEHRSRKSSSRERDRSRKRSRSRDKLRHEKKKKDKKSRSISRDKSRGRDRSRDKERSRESDRHRKSSHKNSRHKKNEPISSTDNLDKRSKEILEQLNKIAPPLEDRLWKHVPQEDIMPGNAPLDSDSDHEVPSSTVTIPTPPRSQDLDDFQITSQSSNDSKASVLLKEVIEPEERGLSPPPRTSPTQIWSGTINMVDVAQISITAHEVSGDCSGLGKELSENLDIVGRISPETVWDYIGKMRMSNSKIISLIRLNATNIEEQMPYLALYSYLSSRNRLGVVKSTNKAIKDFYILPLASQKPIPQALLPINGPVKQWLEATVKRINERVQNGFEESRPALLLGIIVRDRRKRGYLDPGSPVPVHKKTRIEVKVQVQPPRSYTPPPMPPETAPTPPPPLPPPPKVDPRLAKLTPPLPPVVPSIPDLSVPPPPIVPPPSIPTIVLPPKSAVPAIPSVVSPLAAPTIASAKMVDNDDDEPYSPGDSDPEIVEIDTAPLPTILSTSVSTPGASKSSGSSETYTPIPGLGDGSVLPSSKLDIQRQMEELNKQIEMQKSEITSITKNIATAGSEIAGSALASIALPSNLQQILDSIKTIGATNPAEITEVADKEPPVPGTHKTDLTIPLMIPKTFTRPLSSSTMPDLSSNTIPLNLPNKSKLTPPLASSPMTETGEKTSVLSSLSEEDLIRKAAEMLKEEENSLTTVTRTTPPPPIGLRTPKRPKMDVTLPPVPGIDD